MASALNNPLVPRNGKILRVLAILRVSKSEEEKSRTRSNGDGGKSRTRPHDEERSLEEAGTSHSGKRLDRNYGKKYELTIIAGTGSGELLDRDESAQATAAVESGQYDLVLTEDLGRIFRRVHAYLFCECCEDYGTRLIALNDFGVDTIREDWRMAAFFAVMRHEAYNRDTAMHCVVMIFGILFENGGVFQTPIYGYIKPKGAKSDEDVRKDPSAEKIYDEWFRRLEEDASYEEVADWLNSLGVPDQPLIPLVRLDGPQGAASHVQHHSQGLPGPQSPDGEADQSIRSPRFGARARPRSVWFANALTWPSSTRSGTTG